MYESYDLLAPVSCALPHFPPDLYNQLENAQGFFLNSTTFNIGIFNMVKYKMKFVIIYISLVIYIFHLCCLDPGLLSLGYSTSDKIYFQSQITADKIALENQILLLQITTFCPATNNVILSVISSSMSISTNHTMTQGYECKWSSSTQAGHQLFQFSLIYSTLTKFCRLAYNISNGVAAIF